MDNDKLGTRISKGVKFSNNRFEIIDTRPVGQGGAGQVLKAHDAKLDRICAIKLLSPDKFRDPDFTTTFKSYIEYLKMLSHQNIIRMIDYGTWRLHHYYVMDFADGGNLRRAVKLSRRVDHRFLPTCLTGILQGLQY